MRFVFQVEVEVERESGKFASRDEIGDQILQELEGCDPGTYYGDNEGVYNTVGWSVTEVTK